MHRLEGRAMRFAIKSAGFNAANFPRLLARFVGDCRGVSAVEFALLLPVMMTLYLGGVETTQGLATNRKVTITAHALADLATQYTDITNADMSNILSAASAIIAPYAVSNLQAVVSELSINAQGQASVVWSDTLNGTGRPAGQAVDIPTSLAVPNSYLVLAEVSYSYNPTYGYVMTGTLTLQGQSYMQPRQSASIARTAS
jgi:Flp pilus assembly protein TadG